MDDRVFKLWEIPMAKPAVVASALAHLDPAALERCKQRHPLPVLRRALDRAVAGSSVRSVRAEGPARGGRRFVDLETLLTWVERRCRPL